MDEKIVIRSETDSADTIWALVKVFTVVVILILLFYAIATGAEAFASRRYDEVYEKVISYREELEAASERWESAREVAETAEMMLFYLGSPVFAIDMILTYILCYLKSVLIVVSNKRVCGKLFFKRIDLPLDSVSAVSKKPFLRIKICTGRGTICFSWIKNRDELYNAICDLLISRQSQLIADIKGSIEM